MPLVNEIAWACVISGFLMMLLGSWTSWLEIRARLATQQKIGEAIDQSNTVVQHVSEEVAKPDKAGLQAVAQSGAGVAGAAEYVRALGELAKSLSGLTPAVASYLIATVLYFFAAVLAGVDKVGH